jgi:hypothetical protein
MTASKEQQDAGTTVVEGVDRRRSGRVIIRIPVTMEAVLSGEKVVVRGNTVAVNIHGAMVLCPRTFDPETKVEICNDRTSEQIVGRITRPPRQSPEGYLLPVEFSKPSPDFWHISFPPVNWKASDA